MATKIQETEIIPAEQFLFKNCIWEITSEGVTERKWSENENIDNYKVVNFDAKKLEKPLFEVNYSEKIFQMFEKLKELKKFPADYNQLINNVLVKISDIEKYTLKINNENFSWLKFVYNTGRIHWRKEAEGLELTDYEKREHDMFFISKCAALGYMLSRFKNLKNAYAVFLTDINNKTLVMGTGKSLFLSQLWNLDLRTGLYIDGMDKRTSVDSFEFEGVTSETHCICIDELRPDFDLHTLMNFIQGDMCINRRYDYTLKLNFDESPKIIISSRFKPVELDPSLRRRLWFVQFSDYYHAADDFTGQKEHTPVMDFGKKLIAEYSDDEKNLLFNFLAECLQLYLKFGTKIEIPLN